MNKNDAEISYTGTGYVKSLIPVLVLLYLVKSTRLTHIQLIPPMITVLFGYRYVHTPTPDV